MLELSGEDDSDPGPAGCGDGSVELRCLVGDAERGGGIVVDREPTDRERVMHPGPEGHGGGHVLVRLASPTRHNKAEDATQADVEQGEGHGGSWPNGDAQCQSRGLIVVLVPFTS